MGAEDILYQLDPRKIRIVSGDVAAGYWELRGCVLKKSPELFKETETQNSTSDVSLDQEIEKLNLLTIADANPAGNLLGIGVGALAGLRYFGPVGAVGGAVVGQLLVGNRHEVNLEVVLKDGRKFVTFMDKAVYMRFQTIAGRSAPT